MRPRPWFAILFLIAGLASTAFAAPINVMATVNGFGVQTIGTLTPMSGPAGSPAHLTAKFEFVDPYKGAILDGWYDFRWVQIVTKITDDGKDVTEVPGILGKLPAIDPQPIDQGATEMKNKNPAPFYYNSDEWESGKFGDEVIRMEGVFSMLSDTPSKQPDKRVVDFNSYLVVQDLTANRFPGNKFSVLAGFSWQHFGKGAAAGTSTAGGEIAINDAAVKEINDALQRASIGGDFKNWTALRDQTLFACPEPFSLALTGAGLLALLALGRRRAGMAA